MTNIDAIETLRANYPDACYEQLREAVDIAIEALKARDETVNEMRLINANKLKGITSDTGILDRIDVQLPIEIEPVWHGTWVKMSDADGTYYVCSECREELPRVVVSFNPQFDLFPELKCIDKTTYCPNCGARMDRQ